MSTSPYVVQDPLQPATYDDSYDDQTRALAKLMAPTPAAQLVAPSPSATQLNDYMQSQRPALDSRNFNPAQPMQAQTSEWRINRDGPFRTASQSTMLAARSVPQPMADQVAFGQQVARQTPTQIPRSAQVMPSQPTGMNTGSLPTPQPVPLRHGGTVMPVIPPGAPQQVTPPSQLDADTARLNYLKNSGSGIDQIQNKPGRIAARIGDIALRVLAPGIEPFVPGTQGRNQMLVAQQQQRVGNDQEQLQGAAALADTTQQSAQRAAKAQQDIADAQRDALRNPTAKEADLYNLDKDALYRPTDLGKLAIEANKGAKPDSIQGMYASAVQDALDRGVDPGKDPKVQQLADSITGIQKQPATKAEQRDDRAIEILSKPPNARTAGENAYLNGYNQWVKETKTDPGTARMSVLLQQPIAVADPNNPGGEIYQTKKNAVGMGAPDGIDTVVPKAVARDMTSGPDAKVLNNINTADAHIQQLRSIAKNLKSGEIPILNAAGNWIAQQTGKPAPASFQLLKAALAAEIGKTTSGGVATVEETKEISKAINAANSPAQLAGVFDSATNLMHSKRKNLQDQYLQGMKGKPNFNQTTEQVQPVNPARSTGNSSTFDWNAHPKVNP